MDKLLLWHPLLFSILFVIMPYTQYAALIPPAQIATPFIMICAVAVLLYFMIRARVKNTGLAVAVLTPLLIILCESGTLYEYISTLTSEMKLKGLVLALTALVILIVLVAYIVKLMRADNVRIYNINMGFCMIAGILILYNVINISARSLATATNIGSSGMVGTPRINQTRPLPDIYFVILDEYAAPSQMQSYFHYDMTPTVEYLRQKGFMVTEMTTSTVKTMAILDRRLNMEDSISQVGAFSVSGSLLESMKVHKNFEIEEMIHIRNSKVLRHLKGSGYQYIHMGSWYFPTRYNQLADQNINFYGFQFKDELSTIIAAGSILRLAWINKYFPRHAVSGTFAALEQMPVIAGKPKFIFAHILCPHHPYIFGPNGERSGLMSGDSKSEKQLYLDQHIYITKRVREFVENKLLAPQASPIIIIQADHGARMDAERSRRVFSAVYIPSYTGTPWPDASNSVNTFRFLFNEFFGTNLEIL